MFYIEIGVPNWGPFVILELSKPGSMFMGEYEFLGNLLEKTFFCLSPFLVILSQEGHIWLQYINNIGKLIEGHQNTKIHVIKDKELFFVKPIVFPI